MSDYLNFKETPVREQGSTMHHHNNTEIIGDVMTNPGASLRNIREERGLSLEFVAQTLHLRAQLIEDIEHDAFEKIPHAVFVKGYLRAYAKLLDIDAAPLIKAYETHYEKEPVNERTAWQGKRRPVHAPERSYRKLGFLAFVAAVAFTCWWWLNNSDFNPIKLDLKTVQNTAAREIEKPKAATTPDPLSRMQSLFQVSDEQNAES